MTKKLYRLSEFFHNNLFIITLLRCLGNDIGHKKSGAECTPSAWHYCCSHTAVDILVAAARIELEEPFNNANHHSDLTTSTQYSNNQV